MPCVPTIEQNGIGAIGTDRIYHRGHTIKAAHTAVGARKRLEIARRQGVVGGTTIVDPIELAEVATGEVRNRAAVVAHPDIDRRFTEVDRHQLGVNVRDMDQGHVAEGVEGQQIILRQRLLGRQFGPVSKPGRPIKGCGGHSRLQEITTRDHTLLSS